MRQGFSLLELMIVIGLLCIVAGFTFYMGITPFSYQMMRMQEENERARTIAGQGKALRHVCESEKCSPSKGK